jgi:hypothetical protein
MLCDRRDDLSCKAFTICVGRYGRRAELDRIATRIKDLPRVVQDDCLESVPAQAAELMRMRAMYEARLADTINSGIRDLSINLSPPKDGCCKHCAPGSQPCGNSCISLEYKCHKPPGCACW